MIRIHRIHLVAMIFVGVCSVVVNALWGPAHALVGVGWLIGAPAVLLWETRDE